MSEHLKVSLISHSSTTLNRLESILNDNEAFSLNRELLNEEAFFPESSDAMHSDVMVIALTHSWEKVLSAISQQSNKCSASIIVLGPENESGIIKQAFKSGAVDFLDLNCETDALVHAVNSASALKRQTLGDQESDLTVLVTPKGGAGSTTLVVNLAHAMASRDSKKVLAFDLDLQYGNLPIFYDESPSTRLANALLNGEQIDNTILDACFSQRGNNPNVLATYSDQVISPWDINMQQINDLFMLISERYAHVIVDLPRSIDPVTFYALERAEKICVIVQQTLSDMRIAHQYIRLLLDQGISSERIYIVINRHEKRNTIRENDFATAFQGYKIFTIPNDYKRVKQASDNTLAFADKWKSAPITKALLQLSNEIWPTSNTSKNSLFSFDRSSGKAA